jgi:hypothetical protein
MECNKSKYRSEQFAFLDIGMFKAEKGDKYKPLRPYLCNKCGHWHLTSKPLIVDKLKEEIIKLKITEAALSRKITALMAENQELKSKILDKEE